MSGSGSRRGERVQAAAGKQGVLQKRWRRGSSTRMAGWGGSGSGTKGAHLLAGYRRDLVSPCRGPLHPIRPPLGKC